MNCAEKLLEPTIFFRPILRAGPRGVVYGGAPQVKDLNRATQVVRGEEFERGWRGRLIGGGSGGAPPEFFLKCMSLRMHF